MYPGRKLTGTHAGYNVLTGTPQGWKLTRSAVTAFYIASALAKSAFIATLLRLSSGITKYVLGFLLALTWMFSVAVCVLTWLKI